MHLLPLKTVSRLNPSVRCRKVVPGLAIRCNACGRSVLSSGPDGCQYGSSSSGRLYCLPCCGKRELAQFAKADRWIGYVSQDGARITSWVGQPIARVIYSKRIRAGHFSPMHGLSSFVAIDSAGRRWHGRGSPCMAIRLRRSK